MTAGQEDVLFSGHARLGERFKALRNERGWSIRELSLRTGVTKTLLSVMESQPHADPKLSVLLKLMDAYDFDTIERLLGELPSQKWSETYRRLPDDPVSRT